MRKYFVCLQLFILLALLGLLLAPSLAFGQGEQPQLQLSLSRDWGYGGFDNRIQGLFSFSAEGPEDLARVEFYIDDQLVATVDAPPYEVQFDTDAYPSGEHRLYALGFTGQGTRLESNVFVRVFLSQDEARSSIVGLLFPLLIVIAVVGVLSVILPRLFFRGRQPQTSGNYGLAGGAVCTRCGLPFSRHMFAPNLFTGKLERCPHCGKWGVVPRASAEQLESAEARQQGSDGGSAPARQESEEERLRRQIEESRYE